MSEVTKRRHRKLARKQLKNDITSLNDIKNIYDKIELNNTCFNESDNSRLLWECIFNDESIKSVENFIHLLTLTQQIKFNTTIRRLILELQAPLTIYQNQYTIRKHFELKDNFFEIIDNNNKILIPKEILNQVELYLNKLKNNIQIEQVILFGSYSNNSYHQWSDIDLSIVSKSFHGQEMFERLSLLRKISVHAKTPLIQSLGFTLLELNTNMSPRILERIRNGIDLIFK